MKNTGVREDMMPGGLIMVRDSVKVNVSLMEGEIGMPDITVMLKFRIS